jgi:hypothetical protein
MNQDGGTLAAIASITAAFGTTVLIFRVQRENDMRAKKERVWLPAADWLLLAATVASLLLVLVPISAGYTLRISASASAAASVCVAGYIPAILAHYRIVLGSRRSGPRDNPEPLELVWVLVTLLAALAVAAFVFLRA